MNAVIDRVVQYPNRFQLTNISDGTVLGTFDLSPVTGTVSVVGTILNHDLFQSIADDLASRVKTDGGVVSNTTETFTMAGTRTNISSGETISVSFGKIAKIINDLKAVAFSGNKADIGLGNVVNTADTAIPAKDSTDKFTSGGAYAELSKKVDKVAGSSLMTDAEHNKLSGIADGAEVNVNADWNATSGDAVILNKPTIPTVPVQSVNAKTGAVVLTGSDIATSSADSEKLDSKSVANMLHLGAYDSYTYDSSTGIYTVTRQTTYLDSDYIKDNITTGWLSDYNGLFGIFLNEFATNAGTGFVSSNQNNYDGDLAGSNSAYGISKNIYDSGLLLRGRFEGCTTVDQIKSYLSSNDVYVQFKSKTSHTEYYDEKHFSRSGQPYIEEWKKSEADRSSNILDINKLYIRGAVNCATSFTGGVLTINPSTTDPYIQFNTMSLKAGTYTISAYSASAMQLFIFNDISGTYVSNTSDTVGLNSLTFTLETDSTIYIRIDGKQDGSVSAQTIYNFMLVSGSVALPYQPYEGEVVHGKGLAETLSSYPTSQSVSETYLSKSDASSTYATKSALDSKQDTLTIDSVPTENSTNPITSGGVYTAVAKKLDKGDWMEYKFNYVKNTETMVSISPFVDNGTYFCEILTRGTGIYSGHNTCHSLGVFSIYGSNGNYAFLGTSVNRDNIVKNLSATIGRDYVTVRGDLDSLRSDGGTYTSYIRFRKIADD